MGIINGQFLRNRINNLINRSLSRGSFLAIALLMAMTGLIILLGTLILGIWHVDLETKTDGIINVAWEVLLRAMSPDQLATNQKWPARIILLVITLVGLLLVSTLISILNSVIERRMEFLHRGRGEVHLSNHIVVLNWNKFGIRVIREIANSAEPGHSPRQVAVLCEEDPISLMHDISASLATDKELETSIIHKRYLRHPEKWITIRRGAATNTSDLAHLTSINKAHSVIILQNQEDFESRTIRSVLAIDSTLAKDSQNAMPNKQLALPVVTFVEHHALATRLDARLSLIANRADQNRRYLNYIPLSPDDIRHGIETQVSRHRGLSAVYQDLLNFGGQELYLVDGQTIGGTFGEFLSRSEHATPLCLMNGSHVDFWPNWDQPISNMQVVVLAENQTHAQRNVIAHSTFQIKGARGNGRHLNIVSENYLFVGWNKSSLRLANSLEEILPNNSQLNIILRSSDATPEISTFSGLPIQIFDCHAPDPLDDAEFLKTIDHVVVFADENATAGESDAMVLVDLVACRHHVNQINDLQRRFTVVAELRTRSSRYIAGVRLADDLLVNDSLMASTAVQLAFTPELEPIFMALLSIDDPVELVTRHINKLDSNLVGMTWQDLIVRVAQETGEIALGFRRVVNDEPEVLLNPIRTTILQSQDEVVLLSQRNQG
jgi:hypothetical protein